MAKVEGFFFFARRKEEVTFLKCSTRIRNDDFRELKVTRDGSVSSFGRACEIRERMV